MYSFGGAWGATKSMNGPKTRKNVLNFVYNNRKAIQITKRSYEEEGHGHIASNTPSIHITLGSRLYKEGRMDVF